MSQPVFLIDDDHDLRHALRQGLELEGHAVTDFSGADEALTHIGRDFAGAMVCDIRMPVTDGMTFLLKVLAIDPTLPVILITGHGDVPLAVKAMREGAYDFLEKPFSPGRLSEVVLRALEKRRLVLENRALRENLGGGDTISDMLVGSSRAMVRLRSEVKAVAQTNADVLVYGETGSGKEVVSRAIHRLSERASAPFVAINCGALPAEIIESELFGHEKGAFTGAGERRIGKIEHAGGGTVLLDEIESMPLELQVKLLRVIEGKTIERLGSNKLVPVDVRFIAASKADLASESAAGRFRADLYYRLNVVNITIPPLRDHAEDIPDIFFHLAREARARYRREIPDITPALVAELKANPWPGNVRELRNVADRFVIGLWQGNREQAEEGATGSGRSLADMMSAHEREIITRELARHDGRIKPVYEALGISRKALYEKMRKHAIQARPQDGDA
ncbi:MAG: sigma-54-dependent Fis family transcriptional regulator [Nitratireductor sp.]|nr:sigma-54-dependent Fis family transcriptional regulator [Nitratireductor sp.]MCB1460575.1 sigma-54-dependent Fis family transcriptional regulator [Nitratireductor sp.]